eukprot:CAMPEP_0173392884 /NCGR_PEP_ID=MMETSP1356-20130122/21611_1 /TAXON_ID=77927 ORGANISM="Hemiselmis virescens, Strain PCC157" /NCGR_SAMPLE_ID=MMETSP1356 /ASSEMBLY_ACC=CAM_ASM_000847 /LENGTH=67 /DNA_ID=CAMNT_0014350807 /DNA_START=131 /DNA_END=331 /DNA_ORIENTATION=+
MPRRRQDHVLARHAHPLGVDEPLRAAAWSARADAHVHVTDSVSMLIPRSAAVCLMAFTRFIPPLLSP